MLSESEQEAEHQRRLVSKAGCGAPLLAADGDGPPEAQRGGGAAVAGYRLAQTRCRKCGQCVHCTCDESTHGARKRSRRVDRFGCRCSRPARPGFVQIGPAASACGCTPVHSPIRLPLAQRTGGSGAPACSAAVRHTGRLTLRPAQSRLRVPRRARTARRGRSGLRMATAAGRWMALTMRAAIKECFPPQVRSPTVTPRSRSPSRTFPSRCGGIPASLNTSFPPVPLLPAAAAAAAPQQRSGRVGSAKGTSSTTGSCGAGRGWDSSTLKAWIAPGRAGAQYKIDPC